MSTITAAPAKSLVIGGLTAAAVAAVTTTTIAGVGQFAGISLDLNGGPIPVPGFGMLTGIFSLVGLVLALVLAHSARHPRTTFLRTTIVLTALSVVPDVVAEASVATKMLLMLTHVVAATIVIPAIARRLSA